MTELEYLRNELRAAKMLLARATGIIRAEQLIHRKDGHPPSAICERFNEDASAFILRGVEVLPEGVTRHAPSN